MLSAPTSTAPAASIRSINVASRGDGARSRLIFDPARVGRPCTSNRFFTANGTPASGPASCPAATAASTARALARARSAVTSVNEFRTGSCLAIRASAASVTLSGRNSSGAHGPRDFRADSQSLSGAHRDIRLQRHWPARLRRVARIHPPAAASLSDISRLARTAGFQASAIGQAKGFRDGVDIVVERISGHCSLMGRKPAAAITSQEAPDAKGSAFAEKLRKVCASPKRTPIAS